ncbi:hypothetical protein [Halostella pelagica]|uniref:hypothetical protein n=1 Tax=Halostella pelagica TaxID=2583824 RepID=UPI00108211C2|nr:hypothetical protein [Halostella pelagica]
MSRPQLTAVELSHPDGTTTPGIERERRTDSAGGHTQERVVVAVATDGDVTEIDTAASRVAAIDGQQAELVRDVLGDRVGDTDD